MRRWRRASWASWKAAGKRNLAVMSAAFLIFGLSLLLQPHRWASTPAYHVLLQVFPAQAWGGLFLASGAAMGVAASRIGNRWLVTAALTFALTLTTGWMLSFVARYLTSPDTTPETWVSWAIFDYLLLIVGFSIDLPAEPGHGALPEIEVFRQAVDDALTAAAADQRDVLMRGVEAWSERSRHAVASACAAYGQALGAIIPAGAMPPGDLALEALTEARNALKRAEEAYARATGQAAPAQDRQ